MYNKKTNILLVEDDEVNRLVACTLLSKWGGDVVVAKNGIEAIAQIQRKIFQLVLMDIQMPVMDGFESTNQIRAMDDPYFKTIPIIAFTASGIIEVQSKAIQNGMNDFITKPLVVEELQKILNKYTLASQRRLYINFNLYTDGDADFKKELISLLIENIRELKNSLLSCAQNASKIFLDVVHKVKSTIGMLSDQEFSDALEEIKTMYASGQTGALFQSKMNRFIGLCDQVVDSLNSAD